MTIEAAQRRLDVVLARLPDARRSGSGYSARCPAHDDQHASLSISEGEDGRVLLYCHAGCRFADIVRAAGLEPSDLFPTAERSNGAARRVNRETVYRVGNVEHMRLDYDDGTKSYLWRQLAGAPGLGGVKVEDLPLYGIEALTTAPAGSTVLVVEGEKAADALIFHGILAVGTVTGAAGLPSVESLEPLRGFDDVVLWPDKDDAGGQHMNRLADRLRSLGIASRVLRWPDALPKGDAFDYFLGGTTEGLAAMIEAAEPFTEEATAAPQTLPFKTARDLATETPQEPPWIVFYLLAVGAITELAGKTKGGKTMFLLLMIAAILSGRPFLGYPTRRAPVLLLTEERAGTMRAALGRAGLLDTPDLHILSLHDTRGMPWADVVAQAVAYALEVGAEALFVDTTTKWARLAGDDENSAGAAAQAMEPLEMAAAAGLAVFEARHDRKSGGELGDSARGSSAFGGAADVLLALRRANVEGHPARRTLLGVGRFDGTPEQLLIELQGIDYVVLGDSADIERAEAMARLVETLPGADDEPVTKQESLAKLPGLSASTWERASQELQREGRIERLSGLGRGGRAFGYRLTHFPAPRTPEKSVNGLAPQPDGPDHSHSLSSPKGLNPEKWVPSVTSNGAPEAGGSTGSGVAADSHSLSSPLSLIGKSVSDGGRERL